MNFRKRLLPLALAASLTAAAQVPSPRITPQTLRVAIPETTDIVALSDGVVTLMEKNNYNYAFFSLPYGRMLGGFDYKYNGGGKYPAFSGGAVMVYKEIPNPASSWNPIMELHMLTDDGIDVKLPDEVSEARNYKDGIATLKWKRKGERFYSYNYVDANLNPVLTEFVDSWRGSGMMDVRPLRDGMRAVWSLEMMLYGYADAEGKTVIAPKYKKASDFGDGVALVSTDGKTWGLIDKTGKTILEETLEVGWEPGAFHSGRAWCPGKNAYLDKNGKLSASFGAGSDFSGGYAFIRNSDNHYASINSALTQVKEFEDMRDMPLFCGGLAVAQFYEGPAALINTRGEVKMLPGQNQTLLGTDGEWVWLAIDKDDSYGYNHAALAIADLSGNILYVFDTTGGELFQGQHIKDAPQPFKPEPWEPRIGGEDPPSPPQVPPVSPGKKGPQHKQSDHFGDVLLPEKVLVTVTADPPQGGQIAGGGSFDIGATVPVGALPAKDWAFGGFTCSDKAYEKQLNAGWSFQPTHGGKVTVTAVFYPQGDITEKTLGSAYVGHAKAKLNEDDLFYSWPKDMEFDVILDSDNSGIMAFKFDPQKRFGGILASAGGRKKDVVTLDEMYSVFWAPYQVKGFGTEGGTQYIYLHGGLMMVGNLPSDELRLFFALLGSSDDPAKSRTDDEGSYVLRSKMNDYRIAYEELPDGTLRLGRMQICYPGVGWIYTDEEDKMKWKFTSYLIAMSMQRDERYMPSHFVEGTVLRKQSGPFSIAKYPARSWFSDDAHYNSCKALLDGYYNGTIVSEEPKGWTSKDEAFGKMKAYVDAYSLKWFFAPSTTAK